MVFDPRAEALHEWAEMHMQKQLRLEVLRELNRIDSRAAEESRLDWEMEREQRQHRLDLLRERNQIDGAALDEARLQLETERELREWQRQVLLERNRLDPGTATANDVRAAGGLAQQATHGQGALGSMGRIAEQAPKLAELPQAMEGLMAGEAGSLAAAAGPIGAAVMVAQEVASQQAKAIREGTEDLKRFGREVQMLASDDYLGALTSRVDAAAESVGKIPIVGQIYEAQIKQYSETMRAFAAVVGTFVERGTRLAPFSGAISEARAQADVRGFFADVREAEQLGTAMGRLTDAQSRLENSLRELTLPVKKIALEGITLPVEVLEKITSLLGEIAKKSGVPQAMNKAVDDLVGELRKFLGLNDPGKDDTLLNEFLGSFGADLPRDVQPDPSFNPDAPNRPPLIF